MVGRSARTRFLVSGMLDFMDCFEALIGKNLERTKEVFNMKIVPYKVYYMTGKFDKLWISIRWASC